MFEEPVWEKAWLRQVIESAPDALVIVDSRARIVLVNRPAEEMFGYQRSELLGEEIEILIPEALRERHRASRSAFLSSPMARSMGSGLELIARRHDGTEFPVEISLGPIDTSQGRFVSSAIRDVSDRVRVEHELRLYRDELEARVRERTSELRARERRQAAVAELGQRTIAEEDLRVVLGWAAALVTSELEIAASEVLLLDHGRNELILRAQVGLGEDVAPRTGSPEIMESLGRFTLEQRRPVTFVDLTAERRFQPPKHLLAREIVAGVTVPILNEDHPLSVLGAYSRAPRDFLDDDINFLRAVGNVIGQALLRNDAQDALRRAEVAAHQRDRLADIGAIIAKLVHDFGNSVAGLSMQAQLISSRARQGRSIESLGEAAELVLSETARLEAMIRDFREFAREQRLNLVDIHVDQFLSSVVAMWEPFARDRSIELAFEAPSERVTLRGDEAKLRRVLDNLVKNALEAIGEGPGVVCVSAEVVANGDELRLAITDDGPGVDPSVKPFGLFETTKPDGTGLGLAVSRQIIEAHGGNIAAEPRSPKGTTINVDLPLQGPIPTPTAG